MNEVAVGLAQEGCLAPPSLPSYLSLSGPACLVTPVRSVPMTLRCLRFTVLCVVVFSVKELELWS